MSKRHVKPLSVLREEVQQEYLKTREDFYSSKQLESKVFYFVDKKFFLFKYLSIFFYKFSDTRLYKAIVFVSSEKIKQLLQENDRYFRTKIPKFQGDPYPEIESLYVQKGKSSGGSGSSKSPKEKKPSAKIDLNIQVM
jgi:hypothetical protein